MIGFTKTAALKAMKQWRMNPGRKSALAVLWLYHMCVSPWKPRCCRFSPTCSTYAAEAVRNHGVLKGIWLGLCRLLRCHPFYRGPLYDPVPPGKDLPSNDKSDPK